jgi:hypothetical protein
MPGQILVADVPASPSRAELVAPALPPAEVPEAAGALEVGRLRAL